jgi:hypothetical protein
MEYNLAAGGRLDVDECGHPRVAERRRWQETEVTMRSVKAAAVFAVVLAVGIFVATTWDLEVAPDRQQAERAEQLKGPAADDVAQDLCVMFKDVSSRDSFERGELTEAFRSLRDDGNVARADVTRAMTEACPEVLVAIVSKEQALRGDSASVPPTQAASKPEVASDSDKREFVHELRTSSPYYFASSQENTDAELIDLGESVCDAIAAGMTPWEASGFLHEELGWPLGVGQLVVGTARIRLCWWL